MHLASSHFPEQAHTSLLRRISSIVQNRGSIAASASAYNRSRREISGVLPIIFGHGSHVSRIGVRLWQLAVRKDAVRYRNEQETQGST